MLQWGGGGGANIEGETTREGRVYFLDFFSRSRSPLGILAPSDIAVKKREITQSKAVICSNPIPRDTKPERGDEREVGNSSMEIPMVTEFSSD
jgi:hypothetical protein